ncbi:MAG TPA: hypothetical protein QGI07_11030 [Dehalococcoidia bacterium]|nr:hypothetical protein [Chloroflexota bacterium]MDP5877173.1 hypothetical protein [Dehalococcoidia bacterium]MDP7160528.1 hypothetical protein [Dehalococcoidia bacterium]MDP7213919.1 hypothetical protein [Dehalococcoidia bacterium]MDP7514388.1 hypothetical protein [Dehalococcoidia bacterium]
MGAQGGDTNRPQWPLAPASAGISTDAELRSNTIRPHSSLGYRPPTSETFMPAFPQAAELT